jgi:hypothetical protein
MAALQACMQTREVREALSLLVPEVLDLWAGGSPLKQKLSRPVARHLATSFKKPLPDEREGHPGLLDLLPDVVDRLFESLLAAAEAVENIGPEDNHKRLTALAGALGTGRSGRLLTHLMRSLQAVHTEHPTALAEAIAPAVNNWVTNTDFGALRDAADTMGPEVQALAAEINTVLWRYPAKLVIALSFLPDLFNLTVISLNETLRRFNQASPDLVADITLSLVRSIDGETLGAALHELNELLRKIHTGSALIGDPGRPRLQEDLRPLIGAVLDRVDGATFRQARVALAEEQAALAEGTQEALAAHPTLAAAALQTWAARRNPAWRSRRRRLETLDDLPDETVGTALDEGLSDLDFQELGDIVNLSAALVNRVSALKPELVPALAGQLGNALDADEIEIATGAVLEAAGPALRPVLRGLLPDVVSLLCDGLKPADDPFEDKMAAARERLRSLLIGTEVTP